LDVVDKEECVLVVKMLSQASTVEIQFCRAIITFGEHSHALFIWLLFLYPVVNHWLFLRDQYLCLPCLHFLRDCSDCFVSLLMLCLV